MINMISILLFSRLQLIFYWMYFSLINFSFLLLSWPYNAQVASSVDEEASIILFTVLQVSLSVSSDKLHDPTPTNLSYWLWVLWARLWQCKACVGFRPGTSHNLSYEAMTKTDGEKVQGVSQLKPNELWETNEGNSLKSFTRYHFNSKSTNKKESIWTLLHSVSICEWAAATTCRWNSVRNVNNRTPGSSNWWSQRRQSKQSWQKFRH